MENIFLIDFQKSYVNTIIMFLYLKKRFDLNIKEVELFFLFIFLPTFYAIFNLNDWLKNNVFINHFKFIYMFHKVILLNLLFLYVFYIYIQKIKNREYFSFKNFIHSFFYFKIILIRYIVILILIFLFTYYLYPELLFTSFKISNKLILIFVPFLYLLFSVIQQEFIYRIFFFERYKSIFNNNHQLILCNSLLFMFAHIIYENWFALFATFLGNFLFTKTFLKTKSFYWVVIEHCLYGITMFYLGLGNFFYRTYSLKFF